MGLTGYGPGQIGRVASWTRQQPEYMEGQRRAEWSLKQRSTAYLPKSFVLKTSSSDPQNYANRIFIGVNSECQLALYSVRVDVSSEQAIPN
jgi:hypothetical protein